MFFFNYLFIYFTGGLGCQPAWGLGFKCTGLKPVPFVFWVGLCARPDPVTVSTVTDLRKNEEEDAQ